MKAFGRLLAVVAALGIVFGSMVGCGGSSPTSPKKDEKAKALTPEPPKGDAHQGDDHMSALPKKEKAKGTHK